jgi:hypothetical protein
MARPCRRVLSRTLIEVLRPLLWVVFCAPDGSSWYSYSPTRPSHAWGKSGWERDDVEHTWTCSLTEPHASLLDMFDLVSKQQLLFRPFALVSPLTPAECVSRLRAATSQTSSLDGSVKVNSFRVTWRYQPSIVYVRNSFWPYLFGRFQPSESGTIIRCHFTLHPAVLAIVAFVACMGAGSAAVLPDWSFVLFLLLIVFAGTVLSWGERELLVHDVASALNARPNITT